MRRTARIAPCRKALLLPSVETHDQLVDRAHDQRGVPLVLQPLSLDNPGLGHEAIKGILNAQQRAPVDADKVRPGGERQIRIPRYPPSASLSASALSVCIHRHTSSA